MRLEERDKVYLRDLRRSALEVKSFVASMSLASYLKDIRTQRAVERDLEILGEASRGLSDKAREAFPSVPFRSMIGLRTLLAHAYGKVLQERVWETAKKDIPALLQALDSGPKFQ
jgi:uncharacterized protein with HEPN domain